MQDEILLLNFMFKHVGLFWIHISSTKLDHAEPNQGVHYQTITSVAERENRASCSIIVNSLHWQNGRAYGEEGYKGELYSKWDQAKLGNQLETNGD